MSALRRRHAPAAVLGPFVAAILTALAATASAQESQLERPGPRQGYYFSLGAVGDLTLHHLGDDGWAQAEVGPGWDLAVGEGITDRLALGIRMGTSWVYEEDYRALVGHVSMEMRLRIAGNLFTAVAAGFGFTDFSRREAGLEARIGRISGAYTLALGYDIFPGKHDGVTSGGLALTPWIGFRGGPSDPTSALSFLVGVSLTWWTGLPKDRLELPIGEAFEE